MKTRNKKENKDKTEYKKPRLRVIELAAEEVLVAGCKTAAGTSAPLNPDSCHIGNYCAAPGS